MDDYKCDPRDSDEPEARWANQFKTGYRKCAIELVFYQRSDKDKNWVLSRIITLPEDAKEFSKNLNTTIKKYEKEHESKSKSKSKKDKDKPKHAGCQKQPEELSENI